MAGGLVVWWYVFCCLARTTSALTNATFLSFSRSYEACRPSTITVVGLKVRVAVAASLNHPEAIRVDGYQVYSETRLNT